MTHATAAPALLPSGEFRIGAILSKTRAQFSQRPIALTLATVGGWLPLFVIGEASDAIEGASDPDSDTEAVGLGAMLANYIPFDDQTALAAIVALSILAVVVSPTLSTAVTTHLVVPGPFNSRVSLGAAFARGFSRFLPLVAMMFLASVGALIGLALFIIPGFILLAEWAVIVPVCAFEKLGPIRSLQRSAQLTKGFRWRILALVMIFISLNFAVASARYAGTLYLGEAGFALGAIADLASMVFFNIGIVVAYQELRVIKEGVDVEGVASVFD